MRLTELGLDWLARPQPAEQEARDQMERETGARSIPALVDGEAVVSRTEEILAHLRERHGDPVEGRSHRAMMRAEWPHWVELHGRDAPVTD